VAAKVQNKMHPSCRQNANANPVANQMKKLTRNQNPIVGKFFHSIEPNGHIKWQGKIIAEPKPKCFLVQLCEWGFGQPSDQRLINFDQMATWLFYDSAEQMRDSYDHGTASHYRADRSRAA